MRILHPLRAQVVNERVRFICAQRRAPSGKQFRVGFADMPEVLDVDSALLVVKDIRNGGRTNNFVTYQCLYNILQ